MLSWRTLAFAVAIIMVGGTSAQAAAARTAVSGLGNDANPCTLAQPCRTMQAVFNNTAPGGEIEVLDPAGYGALTITHAITIEGHGWASMNTGAGGTIISVKAGPSDTVTLRGLVLEGFGTADTGILVFSGGRLIVQDSMIRNVFDGIDAGATNDLHLLIANTALSQNRGAAISIVSGVFTVLATFDHVVTEGAGTGAALQATSGGTLNVTLDHCVFSGGQTGVLLLNRTAFLNVMAYRSVFANNSSTGVDVEGGTMRITKSVITGNQDAFLVETGTGGSFISYGDNSMDGNTNPPQIPTPTKLQ